MCVQLLPNTFFNGTGIDAFDLIQKLLQLDPAKRLTIDEAMKHPWISGKEEQSSENLASAQEQLKKFNAKKKLKNAINSVLAVRCCAIAEFRGIARTLPFSLNVGASHLTTAVLAPARLDIPACNGLAAPQVNRISRMTLGPSAAK